jgi:hypothetical protein
LSEPANFFMILLQVQECQRRAIYWPRYVRLRSGADTGHGETDVDGRTDTTEEELSLQEDLAVGDGDDLYALVSY